MLLTAGITRSIRRYLIAGLLVWLPILITYLVVHFIVRLLDGTLALLPRNYHPEQLLGRDIPGMGVIFTIIILIVTGLLVTNFLGNRLLAIWEKLVSRIPLIRTVHSASKQVVNAIVQPTGGAFRRVLLIQYPRVGLWSIAFQTSDPINTEWTDQKLVSVFVPTTPNPTSGFLMFIPHKDTVEVDMTTEEALRMVISLGVIIPDHVKRDMTEEHTP